MGFMKLRISSAKNIPFYDGYIRQNPAIVEENILQYVKVTIFGLININYKFRLIIWRIIQSAFYICIML